MISFEDFKKVEMRVGKILKVEDIEGSRNLYKLLVDFGDEKRTCVSGIKNEYGKEELEGKKFVFVTNLEPRKIMGIESECMILAAEDSEGKIVLIAPEKDIKEGGKVL